MDFTLRLSPGPWVSGTLLSLMWSDIWMNSLTSVPLGPGPPPLGRGHTRVCASFREKTTNSSGKAGPPDGICASVPTRDPLTVDQYLISLVSFVFVANNPHSQKKERKTSDALADLRLSKVAAEPLLQLMHRADKFTKKRARSHPIH